MRIESIDPKLNIDLPRQGAENAVRDGEVVRAVVDTEGGDGLLTIRLEGGRTLRAAVTQGMDLVKGETLLLQAVREGNRMQLQLLARDGGLLRALTAADGEAVAPQPAQTAGIVPRPATDGAAVQALSRLAAEGQGVGKALMALLDALGGTRMSEGQSGIPAQAGVPAPANGAQAQTAQTQVNTSVLLQSDISTQAGMLAQTGGVPEQAGAPGQAGGTRPQAGVPVQASGTPGQDSAPAQPVSGQGQAAVPAGVPQAQGGMSAQTGVPVQPAGMQAQAGAPVQAQAAGTQADVPIHPDIQAQPAAPIKTSAAQDGAPTQAAVTLGQTTGTQGQAGLLDQTAGTQPQAGLPARANGVQGQAVQPPLSESPLPAGRAGDKAAPSGPDIVIRPVQADGETVPQANAPDAGSASRTQGTALERQILSLFLRADDPGLTGEALKHSVETVNARILEVAEMAATLRHGGEAAAEIEHSAAQIRQSTGVGQFTYIQLPVMLREKASTAELYVFHRDKKGKPAEPGASVILLALDTDNMGRVEALVRARDKNVHLKLRAESGAALRMFEERMPVLDRALRDAGFTLTHAACEPLKTPVLPDTAQDAAERFSPDRTRRLDVVI